jgi:hypothetical protein
MKGVGEIQQNATSTPDGEVVYAVDAEFVSDSGSTTSNGFKTVIANATGIDIPSGGTRIINISMSSKDMPSETKITSTVGTLIRKQMWQPTIEMIPADVAFDELVLPRAKSPYIWQVRCAYDPPDQSGSGAGGEDISCDVMSVELQWNATSAWEIAHSGSIKVLNRPNSTGINYYENYSNRAVYLKIEAGWNCGEGIPAAQIFEGLTVSATLDKTAERDVVTFKIEDYMYALEGIKFILSPYYDGMKAHAAVRDILKNAGLPESSMQITEVDFGLPFNNAFEEPQFRFKDGSSTKAAITKIAEIAGMMIFFDQYGTFYYQAIPGGFLFDQSNSSPVAYLYSSVVRTTSGADLIWTTKSTSRNIGDTYNSVLVSTVDRETGNIVHVGINNDQAITNPYATGYQGFRKMGVFRNPALGSKAAADSYLQFYAKKFIVPPRTGRFQLYGRPDIRPMDTIYVDDELFRVVNISLQIDKEQNNFFMNVEGEWFDN